VALFALWWTAPHEVAARGELPIELEHQDAPAPAPQGSETTNESAPTRSATESAGATETATFVAPARPRAPSNPSDAFTVSQAANARLHIDFEQLRGHVLGRKVATVLARRAPLADLAVGGRLEPEKDFERVTMSGSDLAFGTTIVQYTAPRYKLRSAAHRVRTEERIALLAARNILVVAPEGAKDGIFRLPPDFQLPVGTSALELRLKRAALSSRFEAAKSLRSLTIRLQLLDEDAAVLEVHGKSERAQESAPTSKALSAAFAETPHLRDLELSSQGVEVTGQLRLDANADIEGLLSALLP
jgi:hypothetical protein